MKQALDRFVLTIPVFFIKQFPYTEIGRIEKLKNYSSLRTIRERFWSNCRAAMEVPSKENHYDI